MIHKSLVTITTRSGGTKQYEVLGEVKATEDDAFWYTFANNDGSWLYRVEWTDVISFLIEHRR